jgi:hypothetical protein
MAQASVPESLAPPQSSTPLNSTTNQHGGNQKKNSVFIVQTFLYIDYSVELCLLSCVNEKPRGIVSNLQLQLNAICQKGGA